jgi:Tfp pilus assembly protein PilO
VTARFASLSARAQIALVCTGLLLIAVLGYFVLISPKRSTASTLKQQTAAIEAQIEKNRTSAFTEALPAVRSAKVFSLATAMPKTINIANVVLELNKLALDSGITFDQITPANATGATLDTVDPFAAQPIQVAFSGSYYDMLAFLLRLRNLVRVQNGNLFAAGRLFDVSDIAFAEGTAGFPQIQATLTINAFVPTQPQPAAPPVTSTDTTATTTDTTTTTSNPTSASPSTSGGNS